MGGKLIFFLCENCIIIGMLNDTICAISTSLKDGAISIVRLSGDDTFKIIQKISDIKKIEAN